MADQISEPANDLSSTSQPESHQSDHRTDHNIATRNTKPGLKRLILTLTILFSFILVSSRQARSLAEDAFFHPSIMSVSYYSFEHCFAVYSPFFLPVMLRVVLAAIREGKRYKQENKKYPA